MRFILSTRLGVWFLTAYLFLYFFLVLLAGIDNAAKTELALSRRADVLTGMSFAQLGEIRMKRG